MRLVSFLMIGAMSCSGAFSLHAQEAVTRVFLNFVNGVGAEDIEADKTFVNGWGEEFTVSRFRYYVSNIVLSDTINRTKIEFKDLYFLIKENDSLANVAELPVARGITCHTISFVPGVDSSRNMSGAQSGALDPLNGMFWTWRSGYIMAKFEGRSPASALQHRMFEYHIGGYEGAHKVTDPVKLVLPQALAVTGRDVYITIRADANNWFKGTHDLPIADYPACTAAGPLARQFADNYRQMFSIQSVSYK